MPDESLPPIAVLGVKADTAGADVTASFAGAAPAHAAGIVESAPGYELQAEIGRGGMGIVHRARDLALDRIVAVKILHERFEADSSSGARFIGEAKITARLQHPGIPAVYHVGQCASGRPFLAMKLIAGETLDRLLAAQKVTSILSVFEAICQAVGYAHAQGVIHRDLKPANIMVGSFGEVQVMDWGLAKALAREDDLAKQTEEPKSLATDSQATLAGSIIGTPSFMPPEQARGDVALVSERSDVFGLGAILCVLLTGQPPFRGSDRESVQKAAAHGEVSEALARIDSCGAEEGIRQLCRRCLAVDPALRPANAQAVAAEVAALRQAADERARQAEAEQVRAAVSLQEQRKRQRLTMIGGGLLCGVLLIGIAGTTIGMLQANSAWQSEARRADSEKRAKIAEKDERNKADIARSEAEAARDKAKERYLIALDAYNQMVNSIQSKLFQRPGTQELRIELLTTARTGLQQLLKESERAGNPDSTLVRAYYRMGEVELSLGNSAAAEKEYQVGYQLALKLAAEKPDEIGLQIELSQGWKKLGLVDLKQGRTQPALVRFQESLKIAEQLRIAHPQNVDVARDLADSLDSLGDGHRQLGQRDTALKFFERGMKLKEDVLAVNTRLVYSKLDMLMSYERIGLMNRELGHHQAALDCFQISAAIAEALLQDSPEAVDNQRNCFVTCNNLGSAKESLGNIKGALIDYRRGLEISRRLAENDRLNYQAQRDLSISAERVGSLTQETGDPAGARPFFEECLAIRQLLAAADPRNLEAQRDLAVSYERMGELLFQLNDKQAAIRQFEKQRDVAKKLVQADPNDQLTQQMLAVCLSQLGAIAVRAQKPAEGLLLHQEQLAVAQQMMKATADSNPAKIELARAKFQVGAALYELSDFAAAKERLEQSREILVPLHNAKLLDAFQQTWLGLIAKKMFSCDQGMEALADPDYPFEEDPLIVPTVALMRINGMLRVKRLAEAQATAERLAEWAGTQPKDPGDCHYCAFKAYAYCSLATAGVERTALVDKALATIRLAKKERYFSQAFQVQQFLADETLRNFRELPEMQEFLAELK